jgi:hemerythrin-like domain-containing protein
MNPICAKLTSDHRELDALLARLQGAATLSDREMLQTTWCELESRLVRHLEAEEQFLLPLVEASHPAEVERILREHTEIRDRIAVLGVAVELHAIRATDIQALVEQLARHAEHEERELYRAAGEKASSAVEHSIAEALKDIVRRVLQGTPSDVRVRP